MAWAGRAAPILALALGAWACGGGVDDANAELDGPDWTLTFLSPDHGGEVFGPIGIEVAVTGPAPARGEVRAFDLGFFLDGELVARSGEPALELDLPVGTWHLRVDGIDADGGGVEGVLGDEILLQILAAPGGGDEEAAQVGIGR